MNQDELRAAAGELIDSIERQLKKWETWFPNEESEVGVPRNQLLALKHFAEIGLAEHPADSNEPATSEWWERVQPEGEKIIQILEIGCDSLLSFGGKCVCDNPTRRQVRCLAEACGVKLREKQT